MLNSFRFNIEKYLFLLVSLAVLSACENNSDDSKKSSGPTTSVHLSSTSSCAIIDNVTSVICGKVVASDQVTPLINAKINLVSSASITGNISATSDCATNANGEYFCVAPQQVSGQSTFEATNSGFASKRFDANLAAGMTTTVANISLQGNNSAQWVVVPGAYDGVQVLLSQLKGCVLNDFTGMPATSGTPAEETQGSNDCLNKGLIVLSTDTLSPYFADNYLASNQLMSAQALFINCGTWVTDILDATTNATIRNFRNAGKHVYFSDLASDWLTELFPGKITFAGNDTVEGILTGNVVHAGLASNIGNTIDIGFNLPVWTAIDSVASNVATYIEADITSLSNTYTNVHPITVGWRESQNSGCVFYTSYHIEGASSGSQQENAMKYMVQNISAVCL